MSSVLILGPTSELTRSMIESLRRLSVDVVEGSAREVDSVIVVLDIEHPESLLAERYSCRSGLRRRAYENEVCGVAVGTALATGARRVVVVCDGRRLTFGQRIRAAGMVRRLARRIDYECELNGEGPARRPTRWSTPETTWPASRLPLRHLRLCTTRPGAIRLCAWRGCVWKSNSALRCIRRRELSRPRTGLCSRSSA